MGGYFINGKPATLEEIGAAMDSLFDRQEEASDWMRRVYDAHCNMRYDPAICSVCGGTGIDAKRCCSGWECGCQGMPVEFEPCPKGCTPPDWWPNPPETP